MSSSRRLFVAVLLLLGFGPLTAQAQQYFDPGIFQRVLLAAPEDFQPPGARLGSFVLLPGADLAWGYNDNVFYLPENEISDSVWHVRPYADLRSDWNRHALNFSAWADIARFDDFSENDYEDWSVRADGRVDVLQNSWFSADVSYFRLHEDRRTPDAGGPITPTQFDYGGWGAGYDHIFNRLKVGAYYNFNSFDYDDNVTGDVEIIDNTDRNRDQDRLTLRADWQLGPETAIFGSYGWNDISYDLPVDRNGFNRDSDGSTITAGVAWDMTDLLVGDLSVNYSEQSYDDPRFPSVDGWGLGAGLTWTPRRTSTVNVRLRASPQETNQAGTPGYFSQLWSARYQEELRMNLLFNLRGSYTDNDYKNPGLDPSTELSNTEVIRADVGLSYLFNRNVSLSGGYAFERQNSNLGAFEYTANRLFILLGLAL